MTCWTFFTIKDIVMFFDESRRSGDTEEMGRLRKTKIRNDPDIRFIFEYLRDNGPCRSRDIPRDEAHDTSWIRHYLKRMENFRILTKKKGKDGLCIWAVAFDLLSENLNVPCEKQRR